MPNMGSDRTNSIIDFTNWFDSRDETRRQAACNTRALSRANTRAGKSQSEYGSTVRHLVQGDRCLGLAKCRARRAHSRHRSFKRARTCRRRESQTDTRWPNDRRCGCIPQHLLTPTPGKQELVSGAPRAAPSAARNIAEHVGALPRREQIGGRELLARHGADRRFHILTLQLSPARRACCPQHSGADCRI
jgi:hypothetical protein